MTGYKFNFSVSIWKMSFDNCCITNALIWHLKICKEIRVLVPEKKMGKSMVSNVTFLAT